MYAFFTTLLQEFDEVECYWVIGNHGALGGRSRRDYNPETNADRMLGKILDTMFANEKRIKFHIPEGVDQHWYTVADLGVKLSSSVSMVITFVEVWGFLSMVTTKKYLGGKH